MRSNGRQFRPAGTFNSDAIGYRDQRCRIIETTGCGLLETGDEAGAMKLFFADDAARELIGQPGPFGAENLKGRLK